MMGTDTGYQAKTNRAKKNPQLFMGCGSSRPATGMATQTSGSRASADAMPWMRIKGRTLDERGQRVTKIENYMATLLGNGGQPGDPYSGYLGAYNMGVIGYSVSGKAALEQGTMATGTVLDHAPQHTDGAQDTPAADQNWVAFHDTPSIWGADDNGEVKPGYGDGDSEIWSEAAKMDEVQKRMDEAGAWTKYFIYIIFAF